MRIALVSTLGEITPPQFYGGIERIVAWLAKGLAERGHAVTLYASDGSYVPDVHVVNCGPPTRINKTDCMQPQMEMQHRAYTFCENYDIIHDHTSFLDYPNAYYKHVPTLVTTHFDNTKLAANPMYKEVLGIPFSSLSFAQRKATEELNWIGNVYNALPSALYNFQPHHDGYLLFLGRLTPSKGCHYAIDIARAVKMPLYIAAKIDEEDRPYADKLLSLLGPNETFLGEIGDGAKQVYLGHATALLMPGDFWDPCPVGVLEAMALGTPVLARPRGALPELVEDGVTGFIRDSMDSMILSVRYLRDIDRGACRRRFLEKFAIGPTDWIGQYEALYRRVIDGPLPIVPV